MTTFLQRSLLFILAVLCVGIAPALGHGPLRRLFAPRPICVPIAPPCVATVEREVPDTLEGRVVWNGPLPKIESLAKFINNHPDKLPLLNAPKDLYLDPTWRIDPKTNGVANVCVILKRPANGMLPIHPDDKIRKEPVVMDAPFLVFTPHVLVYYPEWFDGKDRGPTGQELILKNSSPGAMNYRAIGEGRINDGYSLNFPSKTEFNATRDLPLSKKLKSQRMPVLIQCDIHTWMHAYAFVFDHPYYAITKEDGTFTIPRVPAGMEVQVMAWHEGQGWLFTKDGKTMTLKKGKNTLDFEMTAK